MEDKELSLIQYFNYDLEVLLDEFNNYYSLKYNQLPLYIQAIYLYFSHLAENSLELLIKNQFNYKQAYDIVNVPRIYKKHFTEAEIHSYLKSYRPRGEIFYGLIGYPLYFFEAFLDYIRYEHEKRIHKILTNIPIIEDNLRLIRKLL